MVASRTALQHLISRPKPAITDEPLLERPIFLIPSRATLYFWDTEIRDYRKKMDHMKDLAYAFGIIREERGRSKKETFQKALMRSHENFYSRKRPSRDDACDLRMNRTATHKSRRKRD